MSTNKGRLFLTGLLFTSLYIGLFILSEYLHIHYGALAAIGLISGIMFANVLYSVLYFVNEFRNDRVLSGRTSIAEAAKIQKRRRFFTWYGVVFVNFTQLFVFASLFQYFYQFGGDQFFTFSRKITYMDWLLYTVDASFKSVLDIPEIFGLHLRNIKHHGVIGGAIVTLVRFLVYSTLVTALLRQWQKWRQFKEMLHAVNIAPKLAGQRLIRSGEEALPGLENALSQQDLFVPISHNQHEEEFKRDEHSEALLQLLIRHLSVGNEAERKNAAVLLGHLKFQDTSSQPYFQQLIEQSRRDPVPGIRAEIVRTLGLIGDRRLSLPLRRRLLDPEPSVRAMAADALGRMKDLHSIPSLSAKLHDQDSEVRVEAVRALGRIGNKHVASTLVSVLEHEDAFVRQEAIFSLAYLGEERVIPNLIEFLHDQDTTLVTRSLKCLRLLAAKAAAYAIEELLTAPQEEVRLLALQTLAEIDAQRTCQYILKREKENSVAVKREELRILRENQFEASIPRLLEATTDQDPLIRERAFNALGEFRNQHATEALMETYQKCKAVEDKVHALRAIGHTGQMLAYPMVKEHAYKAENIQLRRQAIRSMVRLSPENSKEDLLPLVDDKKVRNEAIFALVELREERAIPGLIAMLRKVSDKELKEVIWHSLKQISRMDLPQNPKAWEKWLKEWERENQAQTQV